MEPQVHRLKCLCKRLRTADLLDNIIPRPVCFVPDGKPDGRDPDGEVNTAIEGGDASSKNVDPFRASSIVSLISSTAKDVCGGKGRATKTALGTLPQVSLSHSSLGWIV